MVSALKIDNSLRERRRILRLLDYLKRDDLTGEQMERIGKRLQKSGKRALSPLVRKLWQEKNGTAIYRYTCMLDFFDASAWTDQLIQITLQRKDLEEDGKLALLDMLHESGIDVTVPPFASMTGYGSSSLEGFIADCLADGERGLVRFVDNFLDVEDQFHSKMINRLAELGTAESVALLEILLSFEREEIVKEVIIALGRIKNGLALGVLLKAERMFDGEIADLVRRSIRRLSFMRIVEVEELPRPFVMPLSFHDVQAGPVDFYGARSLWFSWKLDDGSYAAMIALTGESDGLMHAVSYRMADEHEYDQAIQGISGSEVLLPVDPAYALSLLREALHKSRELGFYLPPDFYVDMRFFRPDSIKPEPYVPRFSLSYLEAIVDNIPAYISTSNELLDDPNLEGWILSEPAVYDVAERFVALESVNGDAIPAELLETEIKLFCDELIIPRRADTVKRLLLTADYMQQIGCDDEVVQRVLATALSFVGGFLADNRHPFIRRLILDSIDTARQAMSDGYDLRLEEYNLYDE